MLCDSSNLHNFTEKIRDTFEMSIVDSNADAVQTKRSEKDGVLLSEEVLQKLIKRD